MKDVTPTSQRRNLIIAVAISALILFAFDAVGYLGWGKHMFGWKRPTLDAQAALNHRIDGAMPMQNGTDVSQNGAPVAQNVAPLSAVKRVTMDNGVLHLGYNLVGGKLDSLVLNRYRANLDKPGGVQLLTDESNKLATWVDSGWQGPNGISTPDSNATWTQASSSNMNEAHALVLTFKNASGQTFQRTLTPRAGSYVIDVSDRVWNTASLPVTLRHYARVSRTGGADPADHSSWVNYSGPMGLAGEPGEKATGSDGVIHEEKFDGLKKAGRTETVNASGGWWGITGQYFMTAIMPSVDGGDAGRDFRYANVNGVDLYSAAVQKDVSVAAGGQAEVHYSIYAGPKQEATLQAAGHGLERAIDWGWFAFIAKPLYHVLLWLHALLRNWGLAIFGLTLLLKLVTYPLASQTYRSMAKMKKLQPHLQRIQEQHAGDRQAAALKTMELYAAEKVNPMGGCWPTLIQVPIFFAMYKVVLVAFEMRQAPLFGLWIHDLSHMDPYYVLPVLMGLSMYVQMQMNPPASDPSQQMVFKFMPVMFTVMFLSFPAGLVFYWLCNNLLTIAQQWYIMRKYGR
jgi:YidC/Oxa1 family membrane protein insertase